MNTTESRLQLEKAEQALNKFDNNVEEFFEHAEQKGVLDKFLSIGITAIAFEEMAEPLTAVVRDQLRDLQRAVYRQGDAQ